MRGPQYQLLVPLRAYSLCSVLVRAALQQHGGNCAKDQGYIKPYGQLLNVFKVKANPAVEVAVVTRGDLPDTGEPRFYI